MSTNRSLSGDWGGVLEHLWLFVRKKKRREEGIEKGVFIDRRRPTSTGD